MAQCDPINEETLTLYKEEQVRTQQCPVDFKLPLCLKLTEFNAGTAEYIHVSKELIVTLINFDDDNPMYAMLDIDRFNDQVHGHVILRCTKTCKIEDFNALLEKAKQMIPPVTG